MQNPADLPSYVHPALARLKPALGLVEACWESLYGRKADYLPRAAREPDAAYQNRLSKAVFNNKYRAQIEATAGLLTAFDVTGTPPTMEAAIAEGRGVDGRGSDLKSFLKQADEIALRDDVVYVLTDNPLLSMDDAEGRTAADQAASTATPVWTMLDRRNVLNWKAAWVNGVQVLQRVTLRIYATVPDGQYGEKMEAHYHVFTLLDGAVQLEVFRITEREEVVAVQPPKTAPIPRIPLVAYPDLANPFPCKESPGLPPLMKSAELNIKLFRQESTLDSIEYRVNAPTVYRVSGMPIAERPSIILGENYVIELSRDPVSGAADEVGILEIEGSGIESLRKSVEQTKVEIDAEGLGFLTGARIQRTATEAYLSGAQATASMNGWARAKQNAAIALVKDWCMFTGEDPGAFMLEMDHSLLEAPLDAQETAALLALRQANELDRRTFLELLRMGRQLPPGADIDEIMERIEAEFNAQAQRPVVPNGILQGALPGGVDDDQDNED